MKMVSMKIEEKQPEIMSNEYGFGLRLSLCEDHLEALGIKELPKVGDMFQIQAMACVCFASERAEGEEIEKSLHLQIIDMAIEPSKEKVPASKVIYEKD